MGKINCLDLMLVKLMKITKEVNNVLLNGVSDFKKLPLSVINTEPEIIKYRECQHEIVTCGS